MFIKAPRRINGHTGVKRAIRTLYYINKPYRVDHLRNDAPNLRVDKSNSDLKIGP